MSNTITEGINSYLASLYINMSLKDWTPKSSYLVCRGLVDNGILHGDAVIGVLRERFFESYDEERPDGYSVRYSNYAWIDAGSEGYLIHAGQIFYILINVFLKLSYLLNTFPL